MQKSGEELTPEERRQLAGLGTEAAEFVVAVKERWPGAELIAIRRPEPVLEEEAIQ
jgi:hypothetical protein